MTVFQRVVNDFGTTLASGHTAADGLLVMQSGDGARIGALGANQKYVVTAYNTGTGVVAAIFQATGLTGDTLTGVTAVEGTTDTNLAAGTGIELRTTAGTFTDIQSAINNLERTQVCYVQTQYDKSGGSGTVLGDINNLSASVNAAGYYRFQAELFVSADVVGGFKYTVGGTATWTEIRWASQLEDYDTPATTWPGLKTGVGSGSQVTKVGATNYRVLISGAGKVNAAGTLTIQFAQNGATGGSSVLKSSSLVVTPAP